MTTRCICFHNVSGERARELLFLYGSKGEFLVRPSESNIKDHTLSIHRGNRVTHVKIPYVDSVHRLPTGEEFTSLNDVVRHLVRTPNLLSEKDGTFIEISHPVQIPSVESVINIGFDRYFHMSISGVDAEDLLQNESNGVYLVRESTSNPGEFALSAKNDNAVLHVRIYHTDGKFRVVPKDNFRSLSDLLDNYIRLPMVQNGGSAVRLRMPLLSTRFTAAVIDDRIACLLEGSYGKNIKDGFVDEYEKLHRERDSRMFTSCKEGRKPENVAKNRYRNVVPYDHTRIRLRLVSSDERGSDYINANKIMILSDPRYSEFDDFQRRYISTQGCLPETVSDFWHMIWQEDVRIVVMITKEIERGRVKCSRYWPEVDASYSFGPTNMKLEVTTVSEEEVGDYVRRRFHVTRADEPLREIFHFQFLGWEDNGCPSDSILVFLEVMNECLNRDVPTSLREGPIIVHCSAGIGRTGTFITLDIIVNRIKMHGPNCVVDIQKTVRMLREQRATMVQTEAQYRFIYYAVSTFMRLRRERQQALDCAMTTSVVAAVVDKNGTGDGAAAADNPPIDPSTPTIL